MRILSLLLLLAAALPAEAQSMVDDPMIRWDCDSEGHRLRLEMVQPPVTEVNERELIVFNGMVNFVQCKIGGANWTLLVDLVEYDYGRCAVDPDTIISLLRNDQLVISRTVIGYNCGDRPVLSAARVVESKDEGTRLELCTAATYGEPHRCSPFQINGEAIDDNTVAAHARGP